MPKDHPKGVETALGWVIIAILVLIIPVQTLPKVWNDLYLHTHRSSYHTIELPILSSTSKALRLYNPPPRYGGRGASWDTHNIKLHLVADPLTGEQNAVFVPKFDAHLGPGRTISLLFNPHAPGKSSPETSLRLIHVDAWPSGWVTTVLLLLNVAVVAFVIFNLRSRQQNHAPSKPPHQAQNPSRRRKSPRRRKSSRR